MKIFIRLFILFLGCIFISSCQSDVDVLKDNTRLNLKSPNSKVLANDLDDLLNFIKSTSTKKIASTDDIVLQNIKYFEDTHYSFGVIDYQVNGKFNSLLKIIELEEDYIVLSDKHSIQLVKNNSSTKSNTSNVKDKSVIYHKFGGGGQYNCQGGNCCSWAIVGEGRFNCGCANPTSIILTTSDGCEIEIP